jgi:PAS domain S-box-containing protein
MKEQLTDTAMYKAIFESALAGFFVIDMDGFILKANAAGERMFGYKNNELLHKKMDILFLEGYSKEFKILIKKPILEPVQVLGLRKDGATFTADISIGTTAIEGSNITTVYCKPSDPWGVTAHKETALALKNEKESLYEYLNTAASIFLVINRDHTIQLVNKKGCEILGYHQDEIIGKNWFNTFIPRPNRKELKSLFDAVMNGSAPPPDFHEDWILTKEGEKRLISWRNSILKNGDEHPTRLISSGTDITDAKEVQNALDLRNRALEVAGNGLIIVDAKQPDLPILYSNTAFTKMTGYDQAEVLGKNCRFLQNDDRDQAEINTLNLAIERGESCRVTLRNYRKDGTLFWNELTITPLYDEHQELTHFIGVQSDVSEIQVTKTQLESKVAHRTKEIEATVQKLVETNLNLEDQVQVTKLAENKAQRSQDQFAVIAKNFPKGLIVVFNTDFELVYVEGAELKKVNLKKTDFEGKRVDDVPIFSERQIERIKEDITKTAHGQSLSFEVEFQHNNYAVNSAPISSDNDDIVQALFVYSNITEQKKIQEELANALKAAQELNELKSRFVSMASHEFRTPLSAILSSAILIGKQNEPGKEERRQKHVARIRLHVKQLVVILNDFLSLSKLEEGRIQAKPQKFELIQFCKKLVDEMESTKKEGQTIQLKHTAVEITVFLDPKLLSHILTNLMSNALKYSDEGQEIVLQLKQDMEMVVFKVTDKGIGIPEQEQINLFDRFFRATNATNIEGTGLGLNIVKQYAELMQGSVSFISKTDTGSTFTLQLPINLMEDEENTTN